jgi:hypothetical protein
LTPPLKNGIDESLVESIVDPPTIHIFATDTTAKLEHELVVADLR